MGIEVVPESVSRTGERYRRVGAAVASTGDGLRKAVDQAAAASGNPHVSAGLATFHQAVGSAVRTLAERADRHGTKVTGAATAYRDTDGQVADAAGAQRAALPSAGSPSAPSAAAPAGRIGTASLTA